MSGLQEPLLWKSLRRSQKPKDEARIVVFHRPLLSQCPVDVRSMLVALCCICVGVAHPLATEGAKTALVFTCQRQDDGGVECTTLDSAVDNPDLAMRRAMPFYAATLTVVSEFVAVLGTFLMVTVCMGSPRVAAYQLLNVHALLRLCPIGFVYGLGDFLQTSACNAASAPVVLVIGQSKLLLTALFSRLMLCRKQRTNWFRLLTISCAAAASTDISAGTAVNVLVQRAEFRGACLALVKACLSAFGAVLSERDYKDSSVSFWVCSFQVQLLMLVASLALLPWTFSAWSSLSFSDFFFGGPGDFCSEGLHLCEPSTPIGRCSCVDRKGWDYRTLVAVLAIALNGFATGLTLKYLSAVTKSICNAVGTGVFYVAYVCLGYRPFNVAQANVLAIVILSSYEYAIEKVHRSQDALDDAPRSGDKAY